MNYGTVIFIKLSTRNRLRIGYRYNELKEFNDFYICLTFGFKIN